MINVTLKGQDKKAYPKNTLPGDIAKEISMGLYSKTVAVMVNGKLQDLITPLTEDSDLNFLTFEDEGGKKAFWHSTSHIMAQAVKRLYKDAKFAIGPAIDNGFYYDIDMEEKLTTDDLAKIEKEMQNIINEKLDFVRTEVSRDEALKIMKERNEPYKIMLIEDLPGNVPITLYTQGEYIDLCAGPHIPNTKLVKAFKITSVAGAYWRGDSKNKQLQRLYGISFDKKSKLDEYLKMLEEAKLRDHRKLGKEMDLFSLHEEGPGFPFFHPKGMVLRNALEDFWRKEHQKRGYDEIKTPIILNEDLWHRSGHWDHYKENMYFTKIDEQDYAIKPMNCPGSILLYKNYMLSYRDFPLRLAEMGLVHRHELSGALHGLMRVRAFTQDDAHLYVLPSQVTDEIIGIIDLANYIYDVFGFKYHVELSTRPENSMGTQEQWEMATNGLKSALEKLNMDYKINEGDGAFYGPKIDFHLEDAIGRSWQCGTIQLDFQMPERFDLTYIDSDGEKKRPVMLHRTILGSVERFIGILIEHFAGKFPLWIAPVQVKVLTISEKFNDYAEKITAKFRENDIRTELDGRSEKIGYKIRQAQVEKVPYMIILGEKELETGNISVRSRDEGDLGAKTFEEFLNHINTKIANKAR